VIAARTFIARVALIAALAPIVGPGGGDGVEQRSQGSRPALDALASFDGLGAGMRPGTGTNDPPAPRNPSDNTLAVGPDHIVQIVNAQLAVFTKKGARYDVTGRTLYGPLSTNAIFAGFGGVCEARPNGDAVVRYDQLADRWLVVMPIFRRTVFDADRSKRGQPARSGETEDPGPAAPPGPPPPLPPQPEPAGRASVPAPRPRAPTPSATPSAPRPIRSVRTIDTPSSGRSFPITPSRPSGPTAITFRRARATT
jgi:hypothetical protein